MGVINISIDAVGTAGQKDGKKRAESYGGKRAILLCGVLAWSNVVVLRSPAVPKAGREKGGADQGPSAGNRLLRRQRGWGVCVCVPVPHPSR